MSAKRTDRTRRLRFFIEAPWCQSTVPLRGRYLLVVMLVWCLPTLFVQSSELVVRVPVDDRSEAATDAAASDALKKILLITSGDPAITDNPVVTAAIRSARDKLSSYRFDLVNNQNFLVAQFDTVILENLIRESNSTYWAKSLPPILLWLVVDERDGARFGNSPAEEMLWQQMREQFEVLGVNLRRPLHDIKDSDLVTPETLWRREFGSVIEASERYGMEHLLVGRLVRLSGERFIAEWIYLHSEVQRSSNQQAASLADLIKPAVAMAMQEMRTLYAIRLAPLSKTHTLLVSVRNVVGIRDYLAVSDRISSIQTLEHSRPVAVDGSNLTFELHGISSTGALRRLIGNAEDLEWIGVFSEDLGKVILEWQG